MARDLVLYQSLFEFRRKGIRKTLEKWKQSFSGEIIIALPEMRLFDIREDYCCENPYEHHIIYKLNKKLFLMYQAIKYKIAVTLGVYPEVYCFSSFLEIFFYRIRNKNKTRSIFSYFYDEIKLSFWDYLERRHLITIEEEEKLVKKHQEKKESI